jgi:hypothetical protein
MPLNRPKLESDLLALMSAAMDDESWTKEKTARAMADAIDAFVRGGTVSGVKVADGSRTLTQSGEVKVK